MKPSNCKTSLTSLLSLLFLTFLLSTQTTFSQDEGDCTKTFHHEFKVKENTHFELKNKYGKVNINKWDEDRIMVDVTVTVETRSKEKAEKLLKKIDIVFSENQNQVSAITELGNMNFNGNFSIDYEVKMPSHISVDLSNKFGDMFIEECKGKSEIFVEYGGLKANRLLFPNTNPFSNVKVDFGSANIEESTYGKYLIKYSKMTIETSNVSYLITEFSTIRLKKVNSLIADSQYDTYRVGTCGNVVFNGQFTGLNIEKVSDKLDVDTEYGNVNVDALSRDFESVKATSQFANVTLGMAPDACYRVDGKASFGEIDLPDGHSSLYKKDDFSMTVKGIVGPNPSPKASVVINIEYGNADLD